MFDIDIDEYYEEPELQVEVQLKGWHWQMECLKADSSTCDFISFEIGSIGEAIIFNTPVIQGKGAPQFVVEYAIL
jgi:hypothetical protein